MDRMLRWLARCTAPQHAGDCRKPVTLWSVSAWQSITQTWQAPHRQQDAGEFLHFLAPHLQPSFMMHEWQSREELGPSDIHIRDRGTCWPLTLPVPLVVIDPSPASHVNSPLVGPSIQKLIIQWRNQSFRHAVCSAPRWLPVQVSRFNADNEKITVPVRFSQAVYMRQCTTAFRL